MAGGQRVGGNAYDRPTAPNQACEHKVAEHWHGTNVSYHLDKCRCDDCRAAARRYERQRRRWVGEFPYAEPPLVDAEPARQHVRSLMERGMGPKRIAGVTGVPHGAISKLIYGTYDPRRPPSKKISRENAATLLACPYDVADPTCVDGTEAREIVAELLARGWWKAAIGRRIHGPQAKSLQATRFDSVEAGTLRILRRLLAEPVPERLHGPTGRMYTPKTDHAWRHIQPTTPGVPPEPGQVRYLLPREEPPPPEPDPLLARAKGKLCCAVCGEPLATHPMTRCA